jgi:hypothetical protein
MVFHRAGSSGKYPLRRRVSTHRGERPSTIAEIRREALASTHDAGVDPLSSGI